MKVIVASCCILLSSTVVSVQAETLRVGTECTNYPFNFKEPGGKYSGYDVDVAREVGKRLGYDVEIVCQQWDGIIPALLANKFDVIAASMAITDERAKKIDFSSPYRKSNGQFVAPKNTKFKFFAEDGTLNADGFHGARVGVQRSTTYDRWLQAKVPTAEVMRYDSVESLFLDLKAGRVDAIITNPMKAYDAFLKLPDGQGYAFAGPEIEDALLFGPGCGLGLRKGNDKLVGEINTALLAMAKDQSLEKIGLTYFPFAISPAN